MPKSIHDVRRFWENNPLWVGESHYPAGSRAFFEEHRRVYVDDCFAGVLDDRLFPQTVRHAPVLDLGCGPGFWTVEFGLRGYTQIRAADLTANALTLAQQRCAIFGVDASFSQQNAEALGFADGAFGHVNCLGVIHHTPDTAATVAEIARVLQTGGTANIAVYYRNIFLQAWPLLRWVGKLLARLGAQMPGRGREGIFAVDDVDELVRLYDGNANPIGKSYSQREFIGLLSPYFAVEEVWTYFFPARSLPWPIPKPLHRLLDRHFGFMICVRGRKR